MEMPEVKFLVVRVDKLNTKNNGWKVCGGKAYRSEALGLAHQWARKYPTMTYYIANLETGVAVSLETEEVPVDVTSNSDTVDSSAT